jgi:thiamine-phosphate pyrophosphorylase
VSRQLLRIIDANLNRSSEGLRLLGDIGGDILNDAQIRQQLNGMRCRLAQSAWLLGVGLLSQRDREHAIGGEVEVALERHNIADVVRINAKMVQESLRVIEELARLPDISATLDSGDFEEARVALYSVERRLVSTILRREKTKRLTGLYVVLDTQALAGRDEIQIAGEIIQGGAKAIQLRDKQRSKGRLLTIAKKLQELCAESGVLFIVNDYLDVALTSDADGLHVGQEDLPLAAVREVLPIDKVAGCSVTTLSQAVKAEGEGADYIAVGSLFPTAAKANAIVVGLDILKQVKQAVSRPLVAIGGINEENIEQVVVAGADSVAVIGAVLGKENVRVATEQLVAKIDSARRECQE